MKAKEMKSKFSTDVPEIPGEQVPELVKLMLFDFSTMLAHCLDDGGAINFDAFGRKVAGKVSALIKKGWLNR